MAFEVPTLTESVEKVRQDFKSNIPGSDPYLFPNILYVISKVFGGIAYLIYLKIQYVYKQMFATTADVEALELHGQEYGIARKGASAANGLVEVYGDKNTVINAGSIFTYDSTGITYKTIETKTIEGDPLDTKGSVSVPVIAESTGITTNLPVYAALTGTVTGIDSITVGVNGLGGGSNIEPLESFRERILLRKRSGHHGGSAADYEMWVRSVSGVSKVWVEPNLYGPGTVGIWFLMDEDTTRLYGIPLASDVTRVQDYIDTVKPVTATVIVAAPIVECIDVIVKNVKPNTFLVRNEVANEIYAQSKRNVTVSTSDNPATFSVSWLWQAAANATGERSHQIVAPGSDLIASAPGKVFAVRSVDFQ